MFDLAACHLDLGDLEAARSCLVQTHRIARQLANGHIEPELLSRLGMLIADEGDPDAAALLVGASEAAQQRHDRVLYPAKAKAADRTRLRFEQDLGRERFDERRSQGMTHPFDEAVNLAGLSRTPAR